MRIVSFRGKYYAYERENGQPRRISLRTADFDEAKRRLTDYQASLKRKATTVAEIVEDYLADRGPASPGCKPPSSMQNAFFRYSAICAQIK